MLLITSPLNNRDINKDGTNGLRTCILVFLSLETLQTNWLTYISAILKYKLFYSLKKMGVCKCKQRNVTNQFCYVCRMNVCESCMVKDHQRVSHLNAGPSFLFCVISYNVPIHLLPPSFNEKAIEYKIFHAISFLAYIYSTLNKCKKSSNHFEFFSHLYICSIFNFVS